MTNQAVIYLAVGVVLAMIFAIAFGILGFLAWKVASACKSLALSMENSAKQQSLMAKSCDDIQVLVIEFSGLLKQLQPALLSMRDVDKEYAERAAGALQKIGERQVQEVLQLRKSTEKLSSVVERFAKTLLRESPDALMEPSDDDASTAYMVDQFKAEGMTDEEARAKAGAQIPGGE